MAFVWKKIMFSLKRLKSKRGDESKEVAKDPYNLKRPASALFVVIFIQGGCFWLKFFKIYIPLCFDFLTSWCFKDTTHILITLSLLPVNFIILFNYSGENLRPKLFLFFQFLLLLGCLHSNYVMNSSPNISSSDCIIFMCRELSFYAIIYSKIEGGDGIVALSHSLPLDFTLFTKILAELHGLGGLSESHSISRYLQQNREVWASIGAGLEGQFCPVRLRQIGVGLGLLSFSEGFGDGRPCL
ncbi:hypothetical protein DVH24_000615 [Malus domestica]|uniref:Uncharacterized protein n=1 Tax=Malus domestica TaxID=3750 RepID=A0A498J174_MALDO|nr:hypothetical protein DVH24_000615 [Malus domestica]